MEQEEAPVITVEEVQEITVEEGTVVAVQEEAVVVVVGEIQIKLEDIGSNLLKSSFLLYLCCQK